MEDSDDSASYQEEDDDSEYSYEASDDEGGCGCFSSPTVVTPTQRSEPHDIDGLSKLYDFDNNAFGPLSSEDQQEEYASVPDIRNNVQSMLSQSVQNVKSMRGERGAKTVSTMIYDTYCQGLFMHGDANSPTNQQIIPSIRYIFNKLQPLRSHDTKRVRILTTLANACLDCQQVQAREIIRIYQDLTCTSLTFEKQLKYSLVRQKELALHNLISQYHNGCDLDHTQVQPQEQRAHLWSAYIVILGKSFGLDDGLTASQNDRFVQQAIQNVYKAHGLDANKPLEFLGKIILPLLTLSLSTTAWLKDLLSDINNQTPGADADRIIHRDLIFSWAEKNMENEYKHRVFYDESRAAEYEDLEPNAPTKENEYKPFLSPTVLVGMLVKAEMLKKKARF